MMDLGKETMMLHNHIISNRWERTSFPQTHFFISLHSTTFFGELSILVEDGQFKLDFASLELRTRLRVVQGLDFVSTPRF